MTQKVCPIVSRHLGSRTDVLAFRHPVAGCQFVKGTIEAGEDPAQAALRELYEESGIRASDPMHFIGKPTIGAERQPWYFFACTASDLADHWQHWTTDDDGQWFDFFWHPLRQPLDHTWHPIFHEAHRFIAQHLAPS